MPMRQTLLSLIILLVITEFTWAQQLNDNYYVDNRGRDALLAPRVGFGAGVFTYFGDVNDNNYQHIFTSSYGVELLASANLSRYFDLNLTGVYGNLSVNERTTERSLNFKSEMYIASIGVSYNFNHLYKKPGIIQPFIGFGVSFISFDSKSDMLDANGTAYNYWSDGSIRSLPESDQLAEQASILQRDYTYETDLRQANLDGLGKYDLFTFSLPVTAGVDFKLGKRFSSKISAGFYYTFSDLIDDISDEGEGMRAGDSRNDMFLFSSISLSYSIGVGRGYTKSLKTKYYEDIDFYAMHTVDSDGDGVNDFDDKCASTPAGVKVNENGCPIDSDLDVVADYKDKEDSTKFGNVVNLEGVTLTDEMIAETYDSTGLERAVIPLVYPSGVLSKKNLSKEDSTKLAGLMSDMQNRIESESEYFQLFEEISNEIAASDTKIGDDVDAVYNKVDEVYQKMVEEKRISAKQPLAITKDEDVESIIPPVYRDADTNRDGLISTKEIYDVKEEIIEGTSGYTVSQFYDLVEFYYEHMEDAEIIDFGGVKARYVDGTLNVVANENPNNLSAHERKLINRFKEVDFNGDGKLEPNEVNRMIELFQEGNSGYSEEKIYEMIDMFFED